MSSRWPVAVRAAVSTAIPAVAGSATGNLAAGLIATLGAFTSRFGGDRPYVNRATQLAVVSVALASAVTVGAWAAQVPWLGVAVVSLVAVAAVWLCNALAVGPPGAYVFALACAAGVGVSAARLAPWQLGLLVLAGGAVAWLVQMAGAVRGRRRPERAAVTAAGAAVAAYLEAVGSAGEDAARHRAAIALHAAWNALVGFQRGAGSDDALARLRAANHALHVLFVDSMSATAVGDGPAPDAADTARRIADLALAPETVATRDADRVPLGRPPARTLLLRALAPGSHVRHVMVRVAVAAPLAGAAAMALGIGHPYWAIAAAVLILHQGADRSRTLQRGADRLVGTWVGLILAAGILWWHPQGWWLAVVLAALQLAIEMLVVRHYGLASVFITAAALTISTGARRVDVGELLLDRGSDTLIGCAVGVAVYLVASRFQESTRLPDAIAVVVAAVADSLPHLAADTASLAARGARRDLQVAAIDLRDAADAAAAGSVRLRAEGRRWEPAIAAAEQLAYRAIAACWEMDVRASGPLLAPAEARASADRLRRLAAAVRTGAAPPSFDDCPEFLAAGVHALCDAVRPGPG
ncbi:FUSC family protein [Mycolicibacterium sp. 050158]|uniref:FUSC family protein n=1 Tax=Mycolicibacterium sp. 050158 TaxID=3090602 RepID=UPI00299F1964|nr:FUSC family protein [Mycolicibacterium sp. 050158]MDX1892804.1 FUSC family protein [Mycolicibacterium sp. 050158]